MELKNKIVVITGGATGLGLSITKALLEEGSEVKQLGVNEVIDASVVEQTLLRNSQLRRMESKKEFRLEWPMKK